MDAPAGHVTVCFMNAVGASSLLAWNNDVASKAMALYHNVASQLLEEYHGYMVSLNHMLALRTSLNTFRVRKKG